MTPAHTRQRVYSHTLLHLPGQGSRWRIGYLAEPAAEPGQIRVSRPVADQIASDMQALRATTLAAAADAEEFYADALDAVRHLPRVEMLGEHFVIDRRVFAGRYAVRATEPDADGRYTIGLDLGWQKVDRERCDTVRDDSTWLPPVFTAYRAYIDCFTDPTAALLNLAERAGIAVAWLDRGAIEADSHKLTDDEWSKLRDELHQYDDHVSALDDVNSLFLDQIFSDAGIERFADDAADGDHAADADGAE